MRIISQKTLREFWQIHPTTELPLRGWYKEVAAASWQSPYDVKTQFGNASIVANNRIVFNIKGNAFRLIVRVSYEFATVYIRFIGTHTDYDKINASTV